MWWPILVAITIASSFSADYVTEEGSTANKVSTEIAEVGLKTTVVAGVGMGVHSLATQGPWQLDASTFATGGGF